MRPCTVRAMRTHRHQPTPTNKPTTRNKTKHTKPNQGELTAKYGSPATDAAAYEEGEGDAVMAEASGAAEANGHDTEQPHSNDNTAAPAAAPAEQQQHQQPEEAQQAQEGGQQQQQQQNQQRRSKRAAAPRPTSAGGRPAARSSAALTKQQQAKKDLANLIKDSRRLFALLPLGALIGQRTLVLHGGLFRQPPTAGLKGKQRRAIRAGEWPVLCGGVALGDPAVG